MGADVVGDVGCDVGSRSSFLHGVTFGVFWLAVVRLVNGITPRDLSATGQSLLSTAVGGVGAVVGMYGAGWMVERYSTTDFYAVSIGVAAIATLCSLGFNGNPRVDCSIEALWGLLFPIS